MLHRFVPRSVFRPWLLVATVGWALTSCSEGAREARAADVTSRGEVALARDTAPPPIHADTVDSLEAARTATVMDTLPRAKAASATRAAAASSATGGGG